MEIYTTKPVKEITGDELRELLRNKKLVVSPHAYDYLDRLQRKVFKEEELTSMLERENPRKSFLQENGRYSAYYRRSDGYRKLILEFKEKLVTVVSFMDVIEIPKIKL